MSYEFVLIYSANSIKMTLIFFTMLLKFIAT